MSFGYYMIGFGAHSGGSTIPTGLIVGYEGTIASIPSDWALCDGSNSTPDLSDKMVVGEDGSSYSYNSTGGSATTTISATSGTGGAHSGSGFTYVHRSGGGASGIPESASAAGHTHTVGGDVDNDAPHYTYAPIMATKDNIPLPSGSILWLNNTSIPGGFVQNTDLNKRGMKFKSDNTRATGGDLTGRTFSMTLATGGSHSHNPGGGPTAGVTDSSANYTNSTYGDVDIDHTHTLTASLTVDDYPQYIALTALKSSGAADIPTDGVVMYYGSTGALDSTEWDVCDGTGGTPNTQGKFILGADGTTNFVSGNTGGSASRNGSSSTASSTHSTNHSHQGSSGSNAAQSTTYHSSADWTHSHAGFASSALGLPEWRALYYIIRL